jgi:indolepyruvate decarboxylase
MPVVSDTGDCLFATLRLKASSVFGSSYYGTMGFAVPAAIGLAVSTGKRPLVFVGDGAFQMTGQEICHCSRYGINPIFIVVNNRLWGMEQLFHPSVTNVVVDWPYAAMAELWGGKGFRCDTFEGLCRALEDAERQKTFTLVEVVTDGRKLSEPLEKYVKEQRRRE